MNQPARVRRAIIQESDPETVTVHALAPIRETRVVEIGPQSNYQTDQIRNAAYGWAKSNQLRVRTRSYRDPDDPFMSVLLVKLVESEATS